MNNTLTAKQQEHFLNRGFSRRNFGRIASMLTAGAAFSSESALAQLSRVDAPPDSVFINSNENPLGPSPAAREAAVAMVANGGSYLFNEATKVRDTLAQQEGVSAESVKIYPGSSNPLTWAVLAFCSPSKPFVVADPGYEAGGKAAQSIGAKVFSIPLTKDTYAHDVKAMAAASPDAGLIYICNPNNPTGTLTSQEDIAWLVANKPKDAIVMIDEAYTHITPTAPFNTPMISAGKDVIILRTFSKIYGMAGLRAGAAIARPDLLAKIDHYSQNGMLPITSMAAAQASLIDKNLVPDRRKKIGDVRNDVFSFLDKHNFTFVPSVSNCFMVDVKRPGGQVARAMAQEKVVIGRTWAIWPNHVRVTVGTQDEMNKFKAAFLKVMA